MDTKRSKALRSVSAGAWLVILRSMEHISRRNAQGSVLFCAGTAALCLSALVYAGTYAPANIVLTPDGDISKMNIGWHSNSQTNSLIQVALKADMQGSEFPVDSSTSYNCTTASASFGHYSNKAVVTDLSPSTEYVYRLGDGNGNWTANYFFTTHEDLFSFLSSLGGLLQ